MCLYPSSYIGLSRVRFGFIVEAQRLREIVPSVPGFGRSFVSSPAISYSSYAKYGLEIIIVSKLPIPWVGSNVTWNSCSFWQATVTIFGVILNAEFSDYGGSIAVKLNLKGNFLLSKLPFFTILRLKASFSEFSKSSWSNIRQSTSKARIPVFLILKMRL